MPIRRGGLRLAVFAALLVGSAFALDRVCVKSSFCAPDSVHFSQAGLLDAHRDFSVAISGLQGGLRRAESFDVVWPRRLRCRPQKPPAHTTWEGTLHRQSLVRQLGSSTSSGGQLVAGLPLALWLSSDTGAHFFPRGSVLKGANLLETWTAKEFRGVALVCGVEPPKRVVGATGLEPVTSCV